MFLRKIVILCQRGFAIFRTGKLEGSEEEQAP